MKRILLCLYLILSCVVSVFSQTTLTANDILNKTVARITNTRGVEAKFTVYNSGYSATGTIKTSGTKFTIMMPDVKIWYNGKDLYTYNSRNGETTVVNPTAEELAEANPLAYVTGASKNYSVSFSTVKKNGKYVLELLPKKKGTGIKRVTLTVKKSDFTPEKIVVEPSSGNPISSEILSFATGINASSSEFEYPKLKFKGVEIIDLR